MPSRRRRVSRLHLFYAVAIVGLMTTGSVALDRRGTEVTARVAAKEERIVVGFEPSGLWHRFYSVTAAFDRPDGLRVNALVRVPEERFVALQVGDSIPVRYLPQFPLFARTTDRSTATALREFAGFIGRMPVVLWLALGIPALWLAARVSLVAVLGVSVAWAVAAWPLFFTPPSREAPRPLQASGVVRQVTLVDRSPKRLVQTRAHTGQFNRRLDVPYQVVELAVSLPGGDTVVAVDAVDSGSVTGLSHGARLPVHYDPRAPRDARLAAGTRRFAQDNRYHFLVPVLGCVAVGCLAALAFTRRQSPARQFTPIEGRA